MRLILKKLMTISFKFSDKFPLVTASMTELKKTTTNLAVTENLWKFTVKLYFTK